MRQRTWIHFILLAGISSTTPAWAEPAAEGNELKLQVQTLQQQVRALQNPLDQRGSVSRFDGRWEGKILADKRFDCREGDIQLSVSSGRVEGTRTFFSGYPAPVKGTIKPNGTYTGYQNRIDVAGQFTDASADMWYVDGSCERKVVLRKIGPL